MLIRTLLIWLLALALPAQAVSAATMAFCGPDHHGNHGSGHAPAATAADHAHHRNVVPESAHDAHHAHEAAPHVDESHDVVVASEAAATKAAHGDQKKCSACASCCSLAAIPSMTLAVPVPEFPPTVFAIVVPSVDAFAADGPDRPPRTALA